ncbi:galaxin-like [Lingula anatina]|uniref:Galaxin-like n=1 Tax=Lingula anatina TaxID=7574 RepID=A0A1S3HPQ9_LINAN|nr:galaxin-like [Lingula anatina]XP_013387024.1 galaxin-like [Lingula anatina]|eukprot:XP_013387023.1 galaxin-like [Lingula anatina]
MAKRMCLLVVGVLLLAGSSHVSGFQGNKIVASLDIVPRETIPVVPSDSIQLDGPVTVNALSSASYYQSLSDPKRLPRTRCDRVNEYDTKSQACCGQSTTLPNGVRCCQGNVYNKAAQFCYRGVVHYYLDFNPIQQPRPKCGQYYYHYQDQACCAGKIYIPASQGCCNNVVFTYATQMCVGGQVREHNSYAPCPGFHTDHPSQYGCCNGVSYLYSTKGCCQGNVYDLDVSKCTKDTLTVHRDGKKRCGGQVYIQHNLSCCRGLLYDHNKQTCCEGRVLNATTMYCQDGRGLRYDKMVLCGAMQYDPTRFGCCHGDPFDPRHQGCCAYTVFWKNQYTCTNGYLYPVAADPVGSGNQMPYCDDEAFDPSKGKRCCGKLTYKTGFESCCGQNPYFRARQVCCESDNGQYFRRSRMVGCRSF